MAEYFTSDDLLKRRVDSADWLCAQTKKIVNQVNYGQLVEGEYLCNLELIAALLEVIGCYEPITSEAEDGVKNCITEEHAEKAFDLLHELTGLCWHGKGHTYKLPLAEPDEEGSIGSVTFGNGLPIGISVNSAAVLALDWQVKNNQIKAQKA
jgi:hypothetical protein